MYEDDIAFCAHDAVPNRLPVIPCVTVKEPLIIVVPLEDTIKISDDPLCTTNRAPVRLSVMVNNPPCEPLTCRTIEPELYMFVEPVTPNDPVIRADPVYGNVVLGAYEADIAFCAHDAVPCKDPVMVGAFRLPVTFALPEMITVPFNVCIS